MIKISLTNFSIPVLWRFWDSSTSFFTETLASFGISFPCPSVFPEFFFPASSLELMLFGKAIETKKLTSRVVGGALSPVPHEFVFSARLYSFQIPSHCILWKINRFAVYHFTKRTFQGSIWRIAGTSPDEDRHIPEGLWDDHSTSRLGPACVGFPDLSTWSRPKRMSEFPRKCPGFWSCVRRSSRNHVP